MSMIQLVKALSDLVNDLKPYFVQKSGDTMTGSLMNTSGTWPQVDVSNDTSGLPVGYRATRDDTGASVAVEIGSGGVNHGVYSESMNKWLLYGNGSNVYLPGHINEGVVTFANNTMNAMGDDAQIGDQNVSGAICIKGVNGNTKIRFLPYSGSTSQDIYTEGNGNMRVSGNFVPEYLSPIYTPSNANDTSPVIFQYSPSTSNTPSQYGEIININGSGSWKFQVAFPTNAGGANLIKWRRNINNGGWSSWMTTLTHDVLYSTTGSNGTISLSGSADSYNHMRIYFFENDDNPYIYSSVDVFSPNGKSVNLHVTQKYNSGNMWSYTKTVAISGTSISNSIIGNGKINNANGTATNSDNHIFIIRVEGWNE